MVIRIRLTPKPSTPPPAIHPITLKAGVWFDQTVGQRKVHSWLSHTTNSIPARDDNKREADPNLLPLAQGRDED